MGTDFVRVGARFLVLVGALVGAQAAARAVGDDVDAIVSHGVELRQQGRDREALAEFQRAAAIDRTPRVAGQIGLAEMALGTWVPSAEHLQEALDHPNDRWVQKNRAVLEMALAKAATHLGTLEIWGSPDGAEVLVDGKVAGRLPLRRPIPLVAGTVTVTVRAPGHSTVTRTLVLVPEQLTRENVDLPLDTPPPAAVTGTPGAVTSSPEALALTPGQPPHSPPDARKDQPPAVVDAPAVPAGEGSSWRRTTAWTAAGAGALSLGAAIFLQVTASNKLSDFDRSCYVVQGTGPGTGIAHDPASATALSDAQCRDLHDAWQTDRRWAFVGYAVGGAFAITSAALFYLSRPEASSGTRRAHLDCRPGLASVVCGGVF